MLFFQAKYREDVKDLLAGKEHITDGIGSAEFVKIILIISVVFFLMSLCMFVFMICKRKYAITQKAVQSALIDRYQNFLSGFLILPVDEAFLGIQKSNEASCRLEPKDISNPKRRRILAREIYLLLKDLDGQQASQLTNYFFGLGLQQDVLRMLQSFSWTQKVLAMQMAEAFGIREMLPLVQKFVHSDNRELAIHAILTRIAMDQSSAVLHEIKQELNDWECHKITNALKKIELSNEEKAQLLAMVTTPDSPLKRLQKGLQEEKKLRKPIYQYA